GGDLEGGGTVRVGGLKSGTAGREGHKVVRGAATPCTLLHSRFRARERTELVQNISEPPGAAGHIVVATQVVEAGLDLNAAVLVTEAAPWPSVVQRAGRCNRTGRIEAAGLWWLPPRGSAPYLEADLKAATAELEALEGVAATGEELLARGVAVTEQPVAVLRRADLVGLFDTAPDLSG